MSKYSCRFGFQVNEAAWKNDYKEVVRGLARNLERVIAIALNGWDSPGRGGIYFEGREERGGDQEMIVWMRPNYVPESGDWGFEDYRNYTITAKVSGNNAGQIHELEKVVLASKELGVPLLHRETVRAEQRGEVVYSRKDIAS